MHGPSAPASQHGLARNSFQAPENRLRVLLIREKLGSLVSKQNVITLPATNTVGQALQVLSSCRILSAPVVTGSNGGDGDYQDVLGFLDLQDIVCSFMRTLDLPRLRSQSLAQCMTDLEAAGRDFSARQLSDLEELGGDGSFMLTGVLTRLSVWELVHDGFLFPQETKAVHGGKHSRTIVHRVGLFDRQGQMTHILSQSDVVRWLQQHQHALGPLADRTVQQLGLADRWVLKTPLDTSCIQVMELMQQSGLSSAALVDSEGRIVGNFSVSDLRSIVSESFGSMALPVRDFLAEEHRRQSLDVREVTGSDHQTDKLRSLRRVVSGTLQGDAVNQRLVLGSPDEKFRDVLNKMTQHHLHRLYITGSDRKPLSVITLTDILRCICDDANK